MSKTQNLYLEDNTKYTGIAFGSSQPASGEVVFSTGMTGYVETFTDPSFAGQILVCTYPLIGNYGVPDKKFFESTKIHLAGLIVSELAPLHSHADAEQSVHQWFKAQGVPILSGIDTRALTKKLREEGAMLGAIGSKPKIFEDPNKRNLVAEVSPTERKVYGNGPIKIVAIDCGMKENIVRKLTRKETTVIRVPWNHNISKEDFDALFISNGPGDPAVCKATVMNIQWAMHRKKPILGICLGNQLLAIAAGAKTFKLTYGHRGQNQPCTLVNSERCFITSQNHGFAVNPKTLPKEWKEWFVNANDGSNEGIRHSKQNWRSVQFHPEAAPGPTDTSWIFDEFIQNIKSKN